MTEDKTKNKTTSEEGKEEPKPKNTLLDEVRSEREILEKARDEAKEQADRLEKLKSEELLSGSAGIRKEPEPAKEETALEYQKRVMSGGLNEQSKEE